MELNLQIMFSQDKLMHLLSFAIISTIMSILIIFLSNDHYVKQNLSFMWFALVTIGIVEEYRQYLTPNRSTEFLDAIANIVGATIGLTFSLLVLYKVRNRKYIVFKLLAKYSVLLIPLLIGLFVFDQRPFLAIQTPFQEQVKNLVAFLQLIL